MNEPVSPKTPAQNSNYLSPQQAADVVKVIHKELKDAVDALRTTPVHNINKNDLEPKLLDLQRAVCQLAEHAGFDPKGLTHSVHTGRSRIYRTAG